ncbi:MAG: PIN domain-containing protein [Actinomycetota bacterium]
MYLDTSVLLAQLFAEDHKPPAELWSERLVSSRLLQYETWVRINSAGLGPSHGEDATQLLGKISFIELSRPVLTRVLEPFPGPIRTLDAMHLSSLIFLRSNDISVSLASLDQKMVEAARALKIPIEARLGV